MRIEEFNVRENLDYVLKKIEEHSTNIRALVCPKDYASPLGFADPAVSILPTYSAPLIIWEKGVSGDKDPTTYSVHVTQSLLIRYQMPTFFVSHDLCEALLKTTAPEDLLFSEIHWPMPVMRFMLPLEFSKNYFGSEVPYVTAAIVPEGATIKTPLIIDGNPIRPMLVYNSKPFFLATMLKWEKDLPMHYDSRCPIDRQVGELLHTDVTHFVCTVSDKYGDQNDQENVHTVNRLTNLSINILLAMTAEPELVTPEKMLRPARKAGDKVLRRALWKPNFIGERFKVTYEKVAPEGSHRSPHSHWRVGHWRNQRHGLKNQLIKRIWIKPVFVGLKIVQP